MPMRNPFYYGQAITAKDRDAFVDREEALDTVERAMVNGRNVILAGPRRYGKTSLLHLAIDVVANDGARVGSVTLADCATAKDVAEVLLQGILDGPASWRTRTTESLQSALRGVRAHPSLEVTPDGVKATLTLARRTQSWRDVIGDVLGLLQHIAAWGDAPLCMVIDEFQQAAEIDPALPGVVKRIADTMGSVSLILSGSRRHLMDQLTSGPAAPLARIGTKITLPRIPVDVMADFLVRRSSTAGKLLGDGLSRDLYARAGGIPNEVQHLAFWAYEAAAGRRITGADIDQALRRLLTASAAEFVTIFDAAAPSQQKLLKVLAADGPAPSIQTQRMTEALEVANPSGVMRAARALETKDVIERTEDGWQIVNPFFATWLRERTGRL